MKRVISGILVVALMLGLVGMIAFTAFAEELTPDISVQTPDYGAGAAANLDGITVSVGTVNTEASQWWTEADEGSQEFTGTMEEGQYYWLNLVVTAEPGTFHGDMNIVVNGAVHEGGWGWSGDGDWLEIEIHVDMRPERAEWVDLDGMPGEIQVGTAEAPELTVIEGQASVVAARWVDAQKQPVTAFEAGKVYYLEIVLAPAEGYEFREGVHVYGIYSADETEIVSPNEARAWVRYSLVPGVGKITVTTSGMTSGKPIANVKAEVTGNVTLEEIRIYNVTDEEMVEKGNFADSKNYEITYVLKAKEGYELGKDMAIEFNGKENAEWSHDDQLLYITEFFSTCKKITKAEITVTEPKVGGKISATKVTLPKDAKYTATAQWVDIENYEFVSDGTFQKGHAYQLSVDLEPKEGYVFDEDAAITINGKKMEYGGISESGMYCWAYMEYSFKSQITKVELPALPESIKKGDTLTTDFVKDGKNYTVEATWVVLDEGEVSKVEKDGSYVLMLIASANKGYEFASDAVVTVGGKKTAGALNYGSEIAVYKSYNIGMKEIKRIDLTVPAPNKGNEPQKPTFGKDVHFTCQEFYWEMNSTGNVMDDSESVKTFTTGQYHFLTLMLQAEEGYAFADDVAVYVNGKKVAVVANMNMGSLNGIALSFGRLGKPDNADTADTMPVALWLCMGTVALCGLAVTVAGKKKYCA